MQCGDVQPTDEVVAVGVDIAPALCAGGVGHLAIEAVRDPDAFARATLVEGEVAHDFHTRASRGADLGAIAEKPEVFGRALIFVGLAEGVAIYGLIIAFIVLNR